MNPDDRLERLERRLHDLEELVLDLQAALKAATPVARTQAAEVKRPATGRTPSPFPVPPSPAVSPPPLTAYRSPSSTTPPAVSAEQWIGQRGLLAAGVFLLILAAGYFLKLAFDRGWISPTLRCTGGAMFGLAVAAWGWRIHQGQLRTYGAALLGCGAAIVYLAVWAAVSLYGLLPSTIGLGLLAALSVAVFGAANLTNVEALAAAAVLGAFLAPAVVSRNDNPDLLLLYAFFLAAGLGAVAQKRWRLTTFLIGLSFFTLGTVAATSSLVVPGNALMYAVLGASAGLYVGLRERWTETRFLAFSGGWLMLWLTASFHHGSPGRLIAAGGIVLAAAIWWHAWRSPTVWPDQEVDASLRAESLYFYLTPLWLIWAIIQAAPIWLDRHSWAAWLAVGVPYLAAGYARPRVPFAIVGTTLVGLAALAAWDGLPAVWALLALALIWALLDHQLDRRDGRWYAVLAAGAALYHVIGFDLARRGAAPAFVDSWAISLWLATAVVAELAAGLWRREEATAGRALPPAKPLWQGWDLNDLFDREHAPALLWVLAGTLLFAGVTNELSRFFHQLTVDPATSRLAGGLAVSAWWAVFAAGLVMLGFRRKLKPVRVAGLLVSGLAVAKVLLFDLSQLDALYRVASVFTLGLVSLGVAYLYHRQAKGAEG